NLERECYRLQFLVDSGNEHLKREMEVSIAAGEIVGLLYDALAKQYADPASERAMRSLNVLCVRLVFCLYAEDAGIFGHHGMFHDYLAEFDARKMRRAVTDLFKILDTKPEKRDPYLKDDFPELAAFPYVNGGLFKDEDIEIPPFTDEIKDLLLNKASEDFDWSEISPTIFGAVFESTLNPETRRSGGMHYTSIENIHKVIDPLFLDGLKAEFASICEIGVERTRERKLREFQHKLASLTFLDPAAGSGNFLTETYLSLRRLENNILRELSHGQISFGDVNYNPIQVSINQFYGIEINDFAVTVAKTALWIAESQMMKETESIVLMHLDFLPLKTNASIIEGNALRIDWESIVPKSQLSYIMGNPPFVARAGRMKANESSSKGMLDNSQKEDRLNVFGEDLGNVDYVACWFKKASVFTKNTSIKCAFVATDSICQGQQIFPIWNNLLKDGIYINFAYKFFKWGSEADKSATVYVIIVGFSHVMSKEALLYDGNRVRKVEHISPYLTPAEDIIVSSRNRPLCDVPVFKMGNQPIDNGNYLFTKEEMESFIAKEPKSKKYFKHWLDGAGFLNNSVKYCLWLGNCSPAELKSMPECFKRVKNVKEYREKSNRKSTKKLAETPTRFQTENMPEGNFIVAPEVSSGSRRYIPMGFLDGDTLCSNKLRLMSGANLYHFGILQSNIHMAWTRTVCGYYGPSYQYSINIVYNNFPWPTPTIMQIEKIEKTAQAILDARSLYPDSSLSDLYDDVTMPPELRRAHQNNDRAVMAAYGFTKDSPAFSSESACVAELMKLYQKMVAENG
ncbi:MAG: methylase, partial [Clostridiales bacterium]|nr:methylase [Clostridiales bacterium]